MDRVEFAHQIGIEAKSKVLGISGIVTARSDNLYGCNRYYIQQQAKPDGKVPESYWVDEDDIERIGVGLSREPAKVNIEVGHAAIGEHSSGAQAHTGSMRKPGGQPSTKCLGAP